MKETARLQLLDIPFYTVFTKHDYDKLNDQMDDEFKLGYDASDAPAFALLVAGGSSSILVVFIDSDDPFIRKCTRDELYSICIHESTHVMQYYTRLIDDETRMMEFEACFMQFITKVIWDAMVQSHQFPVLGRPKKK